MIPIPDSLKSRKVWLSIILLPLLVYLNRKLKIGLADTDLAIIAAGVVAWVIGEAHMDAKSIEKNGAPHAPPAPPAGGDGPAPEVK